VPFQNPSQIKKLLWYAEIKVQDENINLGFFKYKNGGKRVIDKKCKELALEGKYLQNYSLSEKNIDELKFIEKNPRNQTSNYIGVSWHKDNKKWRAQLILKKRNIGADILIMKNMLQ